MKRLFSALLALALLLGLTACGEPAGVTIKNELGVDLITVSVLDGEGVGMILPAGLAAGGSDTVCLTLGSGAYIDIEAEDAAHNRYHFNVYLHDGVEVRLWEDLNGYLWAEYPYQNDTQLYEGDYTPAAAGSVLVGTWCYSSGEGTITFDGEGGYVWHGEGGIEQGVYTFDGEWVEFSPTSEFIIGWTRGTLTPEGLLCIEGDAGSYYTRGE